MVHHRRANLHHRASASGVLGSGESSDHSVLMSVAPILWLTRVIMRGRSGASFFAGMIVSAALFFCLEGVLFLSSHSAYDEDVLQSKPQLFLGIPMNTKTHLSPHTVPEEQQPPLENRRDVEQQPPAEPLSGRQMVGSEAQQDMWEPQSIIPNLLTQPVSPQVPDFSDFDVRRRRKRARRGRRRRRLTDEDYEDDDDPPQRYEDDDGRRDAGGGGGFRNEAERLFWLHQQLYLERQRQAGLTQAGGESLASALKDAIQPQAPSLTVPTHLAPVAEPAAQPEAKAGVLPARTTAQVAEMRQEDLPPPRVTEPTRPGECGGQGEWFQATKAVVDAHDAFHRMDGVCFDYRHRRTYALDDKALASLSPNARRDAPFPFAGVLSTALQNRTHAVRGATLFVKPQNEGMHGRWDHLLHWANTVLPLAATRFMSDTSASPESNPSWAAAIREPDSVLLYGVSEQDFYHPDARWMREVLEGLLAYVREGEGQGRRRGGPVASPPERVFLTLNGMRKRPLMCFDTVVVAAPPQRTPGSTVPAASSDGTTKRPWQFFPTVCAAHDLRRFLLSRLPTRDSPQASGISPAPQLVATDSEVGGKERVRRSALLLLRAGRRRWANEDAVVAQTRELLGTRGGWDVRVQHSDRGGVALADVARAVASSDMLISPPGSQLVHMAFLPLGASVIEVRPDCPPGSEREGGETPYARLARECGLRLIAAPIMGCGGDSGGAAGMQAGSPDEHQIDFDSALRAALELMEL